MVDETNPLIEDLTPGDDHQRLVRCRDEASGLHALISIHSTALGPAAGGCRMHDYPSEAAAIVDVERLSQGMTYKNVAADLPLGGGKSVIIGDPKVAKTPAMLKAFGRCLQSLGGAYYTAEDVGVGPQDMMIVASESSYVAGLPSGAFASGDPSPVTARGAYLCMRYAVKHHLGAPDLRGVPIALQGLGHVGSPLAKMLRDEGAKLIVTDVDEDRLTEFGEGEGVAICAPDEIYDADAEVFAPCAMGAVLSPAISSRLKVGVVAGAANNQLAVPEAGDILHDRGIYYAPDYIINGGGIVNVAMEILRISDPAYAENRVIGLVETLDKVTRHARREGIPMHAAADAFVREKLSAQTARIASAAYRADGA